MEGGQAHGPERLFRDGLEMLVTFLIGWTRRSVPGTDTGHVSPDRRQEDFGDRMSDVQMTENASTSADEMIGSVLSRLSSGDFDDEAEEEEEDPVDPATDEADPLDTEEEDEE